MLDIRIPKRNRLHRISYIIALSMLFSISALPTQAHYLWVETPNIVQLGTQTPIEIYFGEFHEMLREKRGGRLDERLGMTVRAIAPSGDEVAIEFEQESNYFSAGLKADAPGVYYLLASDLETPVKDLSKYGIGVVKPFYYARRSLLSFEQGKVSNRQINVNSPQPLLGLDIIPITRHVDVRKGMFGPAVNEEIVFQVFFHGQPLSERVQISIYSPMGWLWEGRLDARGIGRFTPPWPGLYVIDIIYLKKAPGEFHETPYEAERHRATLTVPVQAKTE